MGKNNAVMNAAARESQRTIYKRKFDNILLREGGRIEYHVYKDKRGEAYWIHIKVPSEVIRKFYYDVVFKFTPTDRGHDDLFKWNCKFYANDPAFVYTYAFVFKRNNLFINELSQKMSSKALKEAADEKNPQNVVGYVKSIYFAYLIMENRKLNKKNKFEHECRDLDMGFLLSSIDHADKKVHDREREGKKFSNKKKIEVDKQTLKNIQRTVGKDVDLSNSRLVTTTTKKVSRVKNKSSGDKSVKSVKSVKKK